METAVDNGAAANCQPPKIGRPSLYDACAELICERLAAGELLTDICTSKGMPSLATVGDWATGRVHPEFPAMYARARDVRVQRMADDLLKLADEQPPIIVDDDGKRREMRLDSAFVQWQRNRVDTRKWLLSKLAPKQYGDRVTQEVSGPDGGPIATQSVQTDYNALRASLRECGEQSA